VALSDYKRNVVWHVGILMGMLVLMIFEHRPLWAFIAVPIAWAAFFPNRKAFDANGAFQEDEDCVA
jgi:hypothetical protein